MKLLIGVLTIVVLLTSLYLFFGFNTCKRLLEGKHESYWWGNEEDALSECSKHNYLIVGIKCKCEQ